MAKINPQAEKAFQALETQFDIKLRRITAPMFNKQLRDMGYLNEKGVLTQAREFDFLSDRKVIILHKNKKGYDLIQDVLPYYNFYQKLLEKRSTWLYFEEDRMREQNPEEYEKKAKEFFGSMQDLTIKMKI